MKQFLPFAGVGFVSTVIDIFLLNVLHRAGLSVTAATAIGFIAGATNGYFMNSALVFQQERSYQRYGKYIIVGFGGLLWTELIVHLLQASLGLNGSKLVAVVLVFFWNFALSKVWAFK